eukprot:TRINITY_DN686_c0_g2_i1.p1 TRINITY_DN686_c0_g2~~TRINITY_DN686_c0_g2_i1.p1  ORF type:complete len:475 (+),score=168.75 TRINITY_DN686_c0_g2_i1:583-2007(+)
MGDLNYENDLWEGIKPIYDRLDEGRKTIGDLSKFLSDRSKIEESYSKGLGQLMSKGTIVTEQGTIGSAWQQIRSNQENQFRLSQSLQSTLSELLTEVQLFKKELDKQKTNLTSQVSTYQKQLDTHRNTVNKTQATYLTKTESYEHALLAYEKAKQDPTQNQKQISKYKKDSSKQKKGSESSDNSYQSAVKDMQKYQEKYEKKMKGLLQEFQKLEEKRVSIIRDCLTKLMAAQDALITEYINSNDELKSQVENINSTSDVQKFIGENITGLSPESPVEYEEYVWKNEHSSVPDSMKNNPIPVISNTPVAGNSNGPMITSNPDPDPQNMMKAVLEQQKEISDPEPQNPASDNSSTIKARAEYDYEAADETELGFQEGDIITIILQDESGWWQGELNGVVGLFPGSYTTIIESEVSDGVKRCETIFEFIAENDDELTIKVGDIIEIELEMDGWYKGLNTATGESGLFPSNYVEQVSS